MSVQQCPRGPERRPRWQACRGEAVMARICGGLPSPPRGRRVPKYRRRRAPSQGWGPALGPCPPSSPMLALVSMDSSVTSPAIPRARPTPACPRGTAGGGAQRNWWRARKGCHLGGATPAADGAEPLSLRWQKGAGTEWTDTALHRAECAEGREVFVAWCCRRFGLEEGAPGGPVGASSDARRGSLGEAKASCVGDDV